MSLHHKRCRVERTVAEKFLHDRSGLSASHTGGWTKILSFESIPGRTSVLSLVCKGLLECGAKIPRSATFRVGTLGGPLNFSFDNLRTAHDVRCEASQPPPGPRVPLIRAHRGRAGRTRWSTRLDRSRQLRLFNSGTRQYAMSCALCVKGRSKTTRLR